MAETVTAVPGSYLPLLANARKKPTEETTGYLRIIDNRVNVHGI